MTNNLQTSQIQKFFDFYVNEIRPLIEKICTQEMYGYHGLKTHTDAVVFRGIDYSLSLAQDPMPVLFACAFHDMARTNDDFDLEHGANAVPMAQKIMTKFPKILDEKLIQSIIYAITNHTIGNSAPDYVSACLWDADRTRLSWQYGFDEKFYNTERGKYVASENSEEYIDFQKKCIENHMWDSTY
ncbi:MAG: hypothetical protein IKZ49_03360 [Alphaproteobacteria bacterium]|nr:hypothetical protein [Alphaproteobacteria bacterium]